MQSDPSKKSPGPQAPATDARHRYVMEAANEGLWDFNAKTGQWYFSPRFCTMLGYDPDELEPAFETWEALTHPDDRAEATQKIADCIVGRNESLNLRFRVKNKAGSWRWIECRGRVIEHDEHGAPARVIGTQADITEQRHMEEALRNSREMYRTLVEYQGEGVGFVDENEVFSFANRAAEQIFGLPPGQMIGRSLKKFVDAREWERILDQTRRRKSGHKDTYEMEFRRADGERRHLLVTATPRFDPHGNYLGAFGIFLDITERKRAEAALKEGEERYRLLIESMPLGVGIVQEGRIVFINQTATEMLGYRDREELLGRDALEPLAPEEREGVVSLLNNLKEGQKDQPVRYSTVAQHTSGRKVPVQAFATRIVYEGRPAQQICLMDLSEREQAELERARLQEQLRQAQKLESIGRLAGGIAHDFNNLLTPIIGFSELAMLSLPPADPLRSDLEQIHDAGSKAKELTQQLLAFGRKQMLRVKVLNVNDVVRAAEFMLRRLIRESVRIELDLDPSLGHIRADPGQIQQILLNLALNARDAMPGGGQMTIRTRGVTLEGGQLDTDGQAGAGPHVMLAVADTGKGMDEETRNRVFEPFFTTKAKGRGTGLGLATVHGIVKQHGGHIEVSSSAGRGTEFRIYLPEVRPETERTARPDPPAEKTCRGETILVVEDDWAVRQQTRKTLETLGFTVLDASDGDQALELVRTYEDRIHLLVTDVVMPRINGRELYEKMSLLRPDLKVLYMSGYTEDVIADHGVLHEGIHFIQKPFSLKALAEKVREAIGP